MISNSPGANQFIAKTWLLCLFVGTSPIGFGSFFKHHFVCQLSGLSSITKHSSMNNTHWKSNFKYVLVQKTCLAMWFGFSGGQIISLAHVSKHLRMCHHEVLRTFAALMTANDFSAFSWCLHISILLLRMRQTSTCLSFVGMYTACSWVWDEVFDWMVNLLEESSNFCSCFYYIKHLNNFSVLKLKML